LLLVLVATPVIVGLEEDLDQVALSAFQADAAKFASAVVESPFSGSVTVKVL
jgi:hypothetical protein